MKNSDRIIVYIIGFAIGTVIVSMLMNRRAAKEEQAFDPWVEHNAAAVAEGAEPLPQTIPESIQKGRIIGFGHLPDEANALERVWLLNFDKSYPYVRVVENLGTGEFSYMAADQITIQLAEDTDVTTLKPMLDQLGLRLRMFNRKEEAAVIGVLSTEIDAIPATLEAIKPWSHLYAIAQPDFLKFKRD